jgi:hypothetical protein
MCSGCSGDYAGGFEELGESANKASSGDGPAGWDRPKEDGNRLSAETVRGFEDSPSAQWSSQRTNLLGSIRENGAESSEILVSATHIVEIRVFRVNSARMRELLENESGTGCAR